MNVHTPLVPCGRQCLTGCSLLSLGRADLGICEYAVTYGVISTGVLSDAL